MVICAFGAYGFCLWSLIAALVKGALPANLRVKWQNLISNVWHFGAVILLGPIWVPIVAPFWAYQRVKSELWDSFWRYLRTKSWGGIIGATQMGRYLGYALAAPFYGIRWLAVKAIGSWLRNWWLEFFLVILASFKACYAFYRYKAEKKRPESVTAEAWETTLGKTLFFSVLDKISTVCLLLGLVYEGEQAVRHYNSAKTVFNAVWGPGIVNDRVGPVQPVTANELLSAVNGDDQIRPIGAEGRELATRRKLWRYAICLCSVLLAGAVAYFVWKYTRPVGAAKKKLDKSKAVTFAATLPVVKNEGVVEDVKEKYEEFSTLLLVKYEKLKAWVRGQRSEPPKNITPEYQMKFKKRQEHVRDQWYDTTGDATVFGKIDKSWKVRMYAPGSRAWIETEFGSEKYYNTLHDQRNDQQDHYEVNYFIDPNGKVNNFQRSVIMRDMEDRDRQLADIAGLSKKLTRIDQAADRVKDEARFQDIMKSVSSDMDEQIKGLTTKIQGELREVATRQHGEVVALLNAFKETKDELNAKIVEVRHVEQRIQAMLAEKEKAVVPEAAEKIQGCAKCRQPAWHGSLYCASHIKEIAATLKEPKEGRLCKTCKKVPAYNQFDQCTPCFKRTAKSPVRAEAEEKKVTAIEKKPETPRNKTPEKKGPVVAPAPIAASVPTATTAGMQVKTYASATAPADSVKPEALLGKALNTGRFNPNVCRIKATAGTKEKICAGFQSEGVLISVQHAGFGPDMKLGDPQFEAIRGDGKMELKVGVYRNDADIASFMPPKQVAMLPKLNMRSAKPGEAVVLLTRDDKGMVISQNGEVIDHEQHTCPTPDEGGFSGAPIFAVSDGFLVGMHRGAFDARKTNAYLGVSLIESVIADSKNLVSRSSK